MKNWFTKEFLKASAMLLIVFLAGAGTGYVGGHKYAEYKLHKEFMSRVSESRIQAAEPSAPAGSGTESLVRAARSPRLKSAADPERMAYSRPAKSARRRSRGERRFMSRLQRDLNLNSAQRTNVDRALERHYARIRDIRSQMRPQINSIMQEIRKDVRSFLDDEQKLSFDKMVRKFEERRKRRWKRSRKHHPGDPAGQSKKQ